MNSDGLIAQRRCFYTDPLAAAWMAKRFGMRFGFYDQRGDFREYEVPITGDDDEWRSDRGRFYIVADSLSLLEPRPGDVLMRDGVQEHITAHNLFLFVHRAPDTEWLFEGFARNGGRIIQRDGKPFHWPEEEVL